MEGTGWHLPFLSIIDFLSSIIVLSGRVPAAFMITGNRVHPPPKGKD